ncbi:hypothetical protein EWB00_009941 [Schistosoma japonicum]|uniref:Uncharacterized protein n=2 Tax=Schistosoma japonicum TaxID=6182 RepID=A0A4Z2DQI5_SCHJA|nr:hypothetical protein EWB00_009941 [Schistosoma japonicum]
MNAYLIVLIVFSSIGVHIQHTLGYTEIDDMNTWQRYPNYDYPMVYNRQLPDYHKRGLRNMRMGKRSMYEHMKSISNQ